MDIEEFKKAAEIENKFSTIIDLLNQYVKDNQLTGNQARTIISIIMYAIKSRNEVVNLLVKKDEKEPVM